MISKALFWRLVPLWVQIFKAINRPKFDVFVLNSFGGVKAHVRTFLSRRDVEIVGLVGPFDHTV